MFPILYLVTSIWFGWTVFTIFGIDALLPYALLGALIGAIINLMALRPPGESKLESIAHDIVAMVLFIFNWPLMLTGVLYFTWLIHKYQRDLKRVLEQMELETQIAKAQEQVKEDPKKPD